MNTNNDLIKFVVRHRCDVVTPQRLYLLLVALMHSWTRRHYQRDFLFAGADWDSDFLCWFYSVL